ncbi:hypothetical protein CCS41_11765 [Candidatus Fukatsuia symbiotica]|uniref:Uncharacterized protein n=2 Tax=Yersiniaceae TaxID=1903411 RepID=A0A2U8I7C2_9GAMM|nr:hypothetical protein CCS41_11765 [Candidatus Fukatsuia symbiotica]
MVRGIASEPPDLPPDEYPSVNFQDLLRTKKWPVESDVPVDERVMASEIPLLEQNQVPKRQKTDESLLSLSTSTFVEKLPMYMHTGVDPETETQLSGYDESKKMDILIAWYQKFKKGGYVTYPRLFWILFADCSTRESNNTRKAHISDFKKLAKNLGCTTAEKTLSKYVTEYNKGKLRFKQQPQ